MNAEQRKRLREIEKTVYPVQALDDIEWLINLVKEQEGGMTDKQAIKEIDEMLEWFLPISVTGLLPHHVQAFQDSILDEFDITWTHGA